MDILQRIHGTSPPAQLHPGPEIGFKSRLFADGKRAIWTADDQRMVRMFKVSRGFRCHHFPARGHGGGQLPRRPV
jgi:hypothetical protein